MLQGVRKVLLNSTYGATLNEYCRFHDPRLGASTTGSGRQITTHMINTAAKGLVGDNAPKVVKTISIDKKTGENINEYTIACPDGIGPIYSDTDSVASDSLVTISGQTMKVEDAFNVLADKYGVDDINGKQMVWVNPAQISALSLSGNSPLKGIYRHRTSKRRFRVTLESGKFIDVTEDHSVMVEREDKLIEVKPIEIDIDICVSIEIDHGQVSRNRIASVEELSPFDDEYVYDLVMEDSNEPYFFANGILVHNSCYFVMEKLTTDLEEAVVVADMLVDGINASFPEFMTQAFFCQPEFNSLIRANREIVASSGIFRAKKKYVMLAYDMEGTRIPPDSPKALKTQGSDIKISSTPEMIRTMLKDVTMMVLKGTPKPEIDEYILKFRRDLRNIHNIEDLNILSFASVNTIKTLDEYYMKWERIEKPGMGRVNMPSHVRAAINHNTFIELIKEQNEQPIRNGMKCKVLWLAPNEYGYTNMAFASETEQLPEWFLKHFEVDLKETESKLVDHKLGLIFDPIGWQVPTFQSITVNRLISFD